MNDLDKAALDRWILRDDDEPDTREEIDMPEMPDPCDECDFVGMHGQGCSLA